jgi:steroid delta-isomerase-like uncharacterized protein
MCRPTTEQVRMSSESGHGVEVVQRFFDLMDSHQFDELDSVLAEELVFRMGPNTLDRSSLVEMIKVAYKAFPDFTHHVHEIFAKGDRVVARGTNTGTHLGDLNGMAPTGRTIQFDQIAIYRVTDGRLLEAWEQSDVATFNAQLTGERET